MNEPFVSIILRSFNEGWALRETLPALRIQEHTNWELIIIDSGSTDGSVDLIKEARPDHFIQIAPNDYHPPRVMNLGMRLASSEFGIFINADATPQGTNWLSPLVYALADSKVAAVYGKQIPRPDCRAVFAHDYERCFGPGGAGVSSARLNSQIETRRRDDGAPRREASQWNHFFSMASSGIRKDIWAQRGFNEAMRYSEDDEYTRRCIAQGYRVEYVPESVAMHSHNYTPEQMWKRSFGEGQALAAVWSTKDGAMNIPRTLLLGWANDVRRDLLYCLRKRRLNELPHATRTRWIQRRGKLAGFRDGWEFYRKKKNRPISSTPAWTLPKFSE